MHMHISGLSCLSRLARYGPHTGVYDSFGGVAGSASAGSDPR